MTKTAITGARILADGRWLDDRAVVLEGSNIQAIVHADNLPGGAFIRNLAGGMLVPGFIDTQVNGGGGVLFNSEPTVDGISVIAAAHRRFGTTAMLPTLISDDLDVISRAISAVDDAIALGIPGILGIHIEGPFLNPAKRGIHDAGKFRAINQDAIALLGSLKNGKTLVTLAPELVPAGTISALVAQGVIVAAGHTLASYDDMIDAHAEGLSGVTHLFNAMTGLESRAPGAVGAAFDTNLTCGIIVDGHHVHPAALRAAFRIKGPNELILVTDAMPTVGSTLDRFQIGGTDIFMQDGKLQSSNGVLAGSTLDMATAVRNCVAMMNVDVGDALQMASVTPAKFLNHSDNYGRIAPGYRADLVHLDDALNVCGSWIGGTAV